MTITPPPVGSVWVYGRGTRTSIRVVVVIPPFDPDPDYTYVRIIENDDSLRSGASVLDYGLDVFFRVFDSESRVIDLPLAPNRK